MKDFGRAAVGAEVMEHIDNIDEIIESSDVDLDEDEGFAEVYDLLQQIRILISKE